MRSPALARLRGAAAAVGAAIGDVVRGAAGTEAYAQYLSHLARHHPQQRPLSREDFFRREFSARWDGIRRCC
jgi:uncharacterized short protein YbdD (DUF466 family)